MKTVHIISGKHTEFDRLFEGVLDSPQPEMALSEPRCFISGWINPFIDKRFYTLKIVAATQSPVVVTPNLPRPDVSKKKSIGPLVGQAEFNGFYCAIPAEENISIYVQIDGQEYLWKKISFSETQIETTTESELRKFLSTGTCSSATAKSWRLLSNIDQIVDNEFKHTTLVNSGLIEQSGGLSSDEKRHLKQFVERVGSADFLAQLISSYDKFGEVKIDSPLSVGESRLVKSTYIGDANYLVFNSAEGRFYIGQYLHTFDFIYIPAKSLVLVLPASHYEERHLKDFFRSALTQPELIQNPIGNSTLVLRGLLLNGMSPYHFFYDCLPALFVVEKNHLLNNIDHIYSIKGNSYYPVEKLFKLNATNQNISIQDARETLNNHNSFYLLAGASHQLLGDGEVALMDSNVLSHAVNNISKNTAQVIKGLKKNSPIFWVGISAQKRSWVNQKEALVKTIKLLHTKYPKMAVIFDGMTSNVFKADAEVQDFSTDHDVVSEIRAALPSKIKVISAVGMTSQEKLGLANEADFFIANYSTGSLYPARFCHLAGVAHLSKAMMNVVKDIHVHYSTFNVPDALITDIPDINNPRLDFISYSIDANGFGEYVCKMFESSVVN